ncbi:hypothetical protein [Hirschia baltica]|uniref:Uncharacterized protein n=1 Tax=Hirschia baltica (strain ATCC 49814 / DSM 5838 / IFAM 1418) TaxID=582402 RepID=C6XK89_HIRBI|nr:hypothetical protein [Hirschia baltica]ACT59534.1 hypothetical protein Hbal_1848 [Hirschia baltica ATCC 49814]
MIEKSLKSLFGIVADEAARNRAFARKLEDEILKQAKDVTKARELEEQVTGFNPNVVFKEAGAEGLKFALKNRSIAALKKIVERHNIDPSNQLGSRPTRGKIVEIILIAADKRAKRDAKLFEY